MFDLNRERVGEDDDRPDRPYSVARVSGERAQDTVDVEDWVEGAASGHAVWARFEGTRQFDGEAQVKLISMILHLSHYHQLFLDNWCADPGADEKQSLG
jgi:hypothetical protein